MRKTIIYLVLTFYSGIINGQVQEVNFQEGLWFMNFSFPTPQLGYAASYNTDNSGWGLHKTENGGVDWETISVSGSTGVIVGDICFTSENNGWLTGFNSGKLYKTTDGGRSWTHVSLEEFGVPIGENFSSQIERTSDGLIWIQWHGQLVKSVDNGLTWELIWQHGEPSAPIYQVDFISKNTGFIVGGGKCLKTEDGGLSWDLKSETLPFSHTGNPGKMKCINDTVCIVVSSEMIYKTENGGASWELCFDARPFELDMAIMNLDVNDNNTIIVPCSLWVSNANNPNFNIIYSNDWGNSWETALCGDSEPGSPSSTHMIQAQWLNESDAIIGGNDFIYKISNVGDWVLGVHSKSGNKESESTLFPNPLMGNNSLFLRTRRNDIGSLQWYLTDVSGKIWVNEKSRNRGDGIFKIDLPQSIKPGVYHFYGVSKSGRILKQQLIIQ